MRFFAMKPNVVADIGNSRIKWGLCADGRVKQMARLPADDPEAWKKQAEAWCLATGLSWVLASVQRETLLRHAEWVRDRADTVRVLISWMDLNVQVRLDQPERVGLDRLLNVMAAKDRVKRPLPILIVDAGSAVTVDQVDATGAFVGGVIFPGCRLMAKALHDYTDALPEVDIDRVNPPMPGNSTAGAIQAGVFWAVAGGIKAVVRQMSFRAGSTGLHGRENPVVFLTGGDAELLEAVMDSWVIVWPEMTLEGIRIAAEGLE
jgi:type III pantothenate kinase